MNKQKKFFGQALTLLGTPPVVGLVTCIGTSGLDWLWAAPLTLTTLPLLPFYYLGHNIIKEVETEEFLKRTQGLPRVSLPTNFAHIEESENGWLVHPFDYEDNEEPFDTEGEARLFLQCLHYHEVLSVDTERPITFWIKGDSDTRSETI